jgi:ABC-2 family transporter protein
MQLHPTFFGALRGFWLFTWRTHLTLRRLPMALLNLLLLPVLVYLTTPSPQKWAARFAWHGNPGWEFNNFSKRLKRMADRENPARPDESREARASSPTVQPLRPEQAARLQQIFIEEYERTAVAGRETASAASDADPQRQRIKACYARVEARAKEVLDERQFSQFQSYEKMRLDSVLSRTNGPAWTRTEPFYHWLIDFYFFVMLPLACVAGTGALIREELQADTLRFLTTRPLSRARLLILKYLTQTAWLELLVVLEACLLFAAGHLREITDLGKLLPLFLGIQFLAVMAWSALGAFLGLVTKRYMALALVYGLIVEMGIGRIPTNINTLSLMRHLKTLLAQNQSLYNVYQWTTAGVPRSLAALVVASAVFIALAGLMFTFREYHHTTEMQK